MAVQTNKNRIKSLFFILISIASFANANFGINNSNYQQKEVMLTSITGNKVNIDVGGNTNLKGSLIAAGNFDENGNFVDNKQLDLSTGSLTYSSLSGSYYSSSNSFGGGTELSKMGSSDISFSTNIGYSSSKTQATIGLGNIVIKDKENSDELEGLNRDVSNQINKLYEGSIGTSVEASIDHRFFSEEGQKNIAKDFFVTSVITGSIINSITKESQSIGDTGRNYKITEASQDAVAMYPELFAEYNNPNTPIDRKNELDEQITNLIMTRAGYMPVTVLGMNNDIKDGNKNSYQGYYDPDTGTIFLNNGYVTTADQSVYVLGHEAGHAIADQQGKVFDTKILSEENANVVADYVTRATNFALWYNGGGQLNTNPYTNYNDITQAINNNNLLFAGMDKSKGEGFVLAAPVVIPYIYAGFEVALGMTAAIVFVENMPQLPLPSNYEIMQAINDVSGSVFPEPTHELPTIIVIGKSDDYLNQPLPGISGDGYEQPLTTEFPSIPQSPNDHTETFPSIPQSTNDYLNTFPSDNGINQPSIETIPGSIEQVGSNIYTADYTNKPKQKANSANIGDVLRTPDAYPEDFTKIKGTSSYRNNYTGEIWDKSKTTHIDENGEWKIGLGKAIEPTIHKKITVGADGKVIKIDNK